MRKLYLVAVIGALGSALSASADVLDLRTAGSFGFFAGGYFAQVDDQSTGSGVIDPFVRVDNNSGTSRGYNTTANNVHDTGSTDTFNHALLLSDVPLVEFNSVMYRQFLLDINESGNGDGPGPEISLDEIQIFQSGTANQSTESFSGDIVALADSDLVYRLDPDNEILLNYALNSGSGSGDMFMYIPDSLFSYSGEYVYLYSEFGLTTAEDAGFEEWATIECPECEYICIVCPPPFTPPPTPEPATIGLLGLGLAGLIARARKRTR